MGGEGSKAHGGQTRWGRTVWTKETDPRESPQMQSGGDTETLSFRARKSLFRNARPEVKEQRSTHPPTLSQGLGTSTLRG